MDQNKTLSLISVKSDKEKQAEERKKRNEYVLKRMKNKGDNLNVAGYDAAHNTPKKAIKKDEEAIKEIYGKK